MQTSGNDRRSFFKYLLAGSSAMIATSAIIRPARARTTIKMPPADEVLYQETEQFKKYYKSLR